MKVRIKNKDNSKISLITLLIVSCVALSIGYSALSTTLKINGVASVDGMSFKIEFQNLSEASLTGSAVKITDPVISEDKTELKSYNVNFLDPGDSISYTFQIANNGTINAKLSEIVKDTISCEGYGNGEQATIDANNVCANLEYTLKYANEEKHYNDNNLNVSMSNDIEVNDVLNAGDVKDMILTLKYKSPVDGATIEEPQDDVSISGLGISLTYSQVKTPTIASSKPDTPVISTSFAEDSWKTIANNVKTGNTSNYHVGDTKEVDLGTYGKHKVRIANMNTPNECKQEGFSQSACGFVVEFTDIITTHNMNPKGEYKGKTYDYGWNKDGWPASQMKTFIDNDIYNSLPDDLKKVIIDTKTISGHGKLDSENHISTDKLYLLATAEVWKDGDRVDAARDKTRQLDYYNSKGVTTSSYAAAIKKDSTGTAAKWWLRCASSGGDNCFCFVNDSGRSGIYVANGTNGVSPAFRLEGPVEESINTVSFADDSWNTIAEAVKAGKTENYKVGDTKEVDLGTYGKHTLRIANMSTPDECNQNGFSQSACGFVVEFTDIITTHNMNPSGDYNGKTYSSGWNKDGWPKSQMKTFVDNDIYSSLPNDLKGVIITTETVSGHGSEDANNFTSTDKLYLLSTAEIWAQGTSNTIDYDAARGKTRQLDYYKSKGVTTGDYADAIKNNSSGTASLWWLRCANSNTNTGFYAVAINGNWSGSITTVARNTYGVSPAFRIG